MFIIYNKITGDVIRQLVQPNAPTNIPINHEVLEITSDSIAFKELVVTNGIVVEKPPKPSDQHSWTSNGWELDLSIVTKDIISTRNSLLQQSDWTQLPDSPQVSTAQWKQYRQALRDITKQPGFPTDVIWPTPPGG